MKSSVTNIIEPLIFFAVLLILWEVLVEVIQVPSFILPPPGDLWTSFIKKLPILGHHSLITFVEAVGGFTSLFGSRGDVRHCRSLLAPSPEYALPAHRDSLRHAEERLRAAHGDLGRLRAYF